MRLACLMALALPVLGQVSWHARPKTWRGIASAQVLRAAPSRGVACWDGELVASNLYEADRAQPVLREYATLPAPPKPARAVVAFRDGRVEPVLAYWVEGEELVVLTPGEMVRRVGVATVDVVRSVSLNRAWGRSFSLK